MATNCVTEKTEPREEELWTLLPHSFKTYELVLLNSSWAKMGLGGGVGMVPEPPGAVYKRSHVCVLWGKDLCH